MPKFIITDQNGKKHVKTAPTILDALDCRKSHLTRSWVETFWGRTSQCETTLQFIELDDGSLLEKCSVVHIAPEKLA